MKTINRMALTITARQPYIDWANSFDDDGPKMEDEPPPSISVLISEKYDEFNYEDFLKKHYRELFEMELDAWMTNPDIWPKNRN